MQGLIACSTFALALTIAVGRPRITSQLEMGPAAAAAAGTVCLLLFGTIGPADILVALDTLWRPLVGILAIMITTAAARGVGLIDVLAGTMLTGRARSVPQLFRRVFLLSLGTATFLNNDAAVLLLTPLVLSFVRHHYPDQPRLLIPFAFGVFMAAGVAPFVISNPMNMVVASFAGFDFNGYAAVMLPIALAGSLVTFLLLARLFAAELTGPAMQPLPGPCVSFSRAHIRMLILIGAVTVSHPILAALNAAPVWAIAAAGAMLALLLARHDAAVSPYRLIADGVSWDVMIFLPAVFLLTLGLRNVGLVEMLSAWYAGAGPAVIGTTSAIGSAVLNNHPMALVNMLALDARAGVGPPEYLAALIGGDLGPRLLPTGSLAGLLWIDACRRLDVRVTPAIFIRVGGILTVPTLVASLALLTFL